MDLRSTNLTDEKAALQYQPAQWRGIVEDLAEEYSCPISEVEQILMAETHQLEQGAHITVFVPLLAIKQVKDLLEPYRHTPARHEQRNLNHPQASG